MYGNGAWTTRILAQLQIHISMTSAIPTAPWALIAYYGGAAGAIENGGAERPPASVVIQRELKPMPLASAWHWPPRKNSFWTVGCALRNGRVEQRFVGCAGRKAPRCYALLYPQLFAAGTQRNSSLSTAHSRLKSYTIALFFLAIG